MCAATPPTAAPRAVALGALDRARAATQTQQYVADRAQFERIAAERTMQHATVDQPAAPEHSEASTADASASTADDAEGESQSKRMRLSEDGAAASR